MMTIRRRTLVAGSAAALGLGWLGAGAPGEDAGRPARLPRFAICNETFKGWPFDKAFGFAAECGYTGIEIAPFTIADYVTDIPASKRSEVRRQAEKAGLEVIGLHWLLAKTQGFHVTSADASVRRKTAEYLAELARFCADLGGKLLVFGSPKQRDLAPGMSRREGMEHAAEVFRALTPVLEKTGVMLLLEPLSPDTTNFLTTAAEAAELADMIGSPRCRLHLDTRAMSSEAVPIPELIYKHRAALAHFHANDANGRGPGFGKVDFVPIFEALQRIGYGGWISVEVFDDQPPPEQTARQSIAYMRRCWSEAARRGR
jgi:sugar phosphate isomerase/epimerase